MSCPPLRILGTLALACFVAPAQAAVITFTTSLASEVADSIGSGSSTVVYDGDTRTLQVLITFANLTGTTTVAHIHAPTAIAGTGTIGVAVYPGTFPGFPVGVTAGNYISGELDLTNPATYTASFLTLFGGTVAGAEAGLLAAMLDGKAYVNVHTTHAPGGEIRGFLARVPDATSTALLFGSALVLLASIARLRRPAMVESQP